MSHLSIAIVSLFLAAGAAFAQTGPPDASLTANSLFVKNCAKCHGKTAGGRHFGGPSLISDKISSTPAEDLRNIVTDGKGHMPKFGAKLTPDQIDTLVRQIKALNHKK